MTSKYEGKMKRGSKHFKRKEALGFDGRGVARASEGDCSLLKYNLIIK